MPIEGGLRFPLHVDRSASYQLESAVVFASGPAKLRRRVTISASENNPRDMRGIKVTTLPNGVFFLKVIVTGLRLISRFCLTSAISLTGTVMSWRKFEMTRVTPSSLTLFNRAHVNKRKAVPLAHTAANCIASGWRLRNMTTVPRPNPADQTVVKMN